MICSIRRISLKFLSILVSYLGSPVRRPQPAFLIYPTNCLLNPRRSRFFSITSQLPTVDSEANEASNCLPRPTQDCPFKARLSHCCT
ncbi:unnamed protein product [Citrullus colocynthis]|uniref:Secreted protein n=1 Tax=Citrullus colocynthis TaxID=252529 RepID=A0ABP0Y870_9ROSI